MLITFKDPLFFYTPVVVIKIRKKNSNFFFSYFVTFKTNLLKVNIEASGTAD